MRACIGGNARGFRVSDELLTKIKNEGWKWSAHTHPGLKDLQLNAPGIPGDRQVLSALNQARSMILNSVGRRNLFNMSEDIYVTPKSEYGKLNQINP